MRPVDLKTFVLSFIRGCPPDEAAIRAGIPRERAASDGLKLLAGRSVRRKIAAARAAGSESLSPRAGLERLAFGRANDAAALAFAEEITPEMLESADLFNVSELKRVKGGGVEIKFFDRQKALERLVELDAEMNADKRARSLIESVYGNTGGTESEQDE